MVFLLRVVFCVVLCSLAFHQAYNTITLTYMSDMSTIHCNYSSS